MIIDDPKVCSVCKRKVSVFCQHCHACPACGHAEGCKLVSGAVASGIDDGDPGPFGEIGPGGGGGLP